jgi:hypothetical protein
MQLDAGVYCIYHSPGSAPPDSATGLPAARLSLPPGRVSPDVVITGFRDDGWLGSLDSAAMIRVSRGPAQILMTIYQSVGANQPPRLQVTKLVDGMDGVLTGDGPARERNGQIAVSPGQVENPEIAAHIQRRGDILARIGEWVGERNSKQWIEGFALAPRASGIAQEDIEYQAVLGRGWLSPWSEGTQYCGSRGMALPILGLRVRLRGAAAKSHTIKVSGTFTDGSAVGPVGPGEACEAESLAPLEAFLVELMPIAAAESEKPPVASLAGPARSKSAAKAKPVPPSARARSK